MCLPVLPGTSFAAVDLYRSVGINPADLNINDRTVEISGSTATFSGPMPDNVGVGDLVQYEVGSTYYISFIYGRESKTIYTVKGANGGLPEPTPSGTPASVYRAYTSLFTWEEHAENTSIASCVSDFDTSTDLVSNDTIMNVACYADGRDVITFTIEGWTTSLDNYINIYTPTSTNEVGTSQRHDGKWDGGAYRLMNDIGKDQTGAITIYEDNVRITGLQIGVKSSTNDVVYGIFGDMNHINSAGEIKISHNIIRGTGSMGPYSSGIAFFAPDIGGSGPTIKILNNIVYDFDSFGGQGIDAGYQSRPTVYIYNNTVYNCVMGYTFNPYWGATFVAKNSLAYKNFDNYFGTFNSSGDYNVSGPETDDDMPGTHSRDGVTVTFVNEAADDFHLSANDIGAKDHGTDLSLDENVILIDDIDGDLRPR